MELGITIWNDLDRDAQEATLRRPGSQDDASQSATVAEIIREVRDNGDAALRRYTKSFDDVDLTDFLVSAEEANSAEAALSPETIAAIDVAIRNVRIFHQAQLPQALSVETSPGIQCERISHAIEAVGLYVPAGTAPLPSAAIMLAVPAALANCPTRVMCTPPRADGSADPSVVAAAKRAGVSNIYKLGGAQAIAALAYGTETIPKVNKIFGPGNSWVTLAKTMVAATPGGAAIDMPAGPSEVLVIADETASACFVAADLLSQAEHGADSQVILATTSLGLAGNVIKELQEQLKQLSRREIAAAAMQHSSIIVVDDIQSAVSLSNAYAPEHLILQVDKAREWLPKIRNAGSVFLGPWAPESVGDYCTGTNHVLPTNGFAKAYSGLGVDQFLRQMSVQELTKDGLISISDSVVALADLEGLDAHAASIKVRLETLQ
ncbi:MAG: histidinol dehydrogenase [Woeseiaceae bacterium]